MTRARRPPTLFARLLLILLAGLLAAQAITVAIVYTERAQASRRTMLSYVTADVASSVAMLDRLPASERPAWFPRLQRANYRLAPAADPPEPVTAAAQAPASPLAAQLAQALTQALGHRVTIAPRHGVGAPIELHLHLQDGTPLSVAVEEPRMAIPPWALGALAAQALLLLGACAFAVRQATRPLARLAQAVATLEPGQSAEPLPETGAREVVQAAAAFNRMRTRIDQHLAERTQMLGAISHDLQTPLTRMRLRAELLPDATVRDKLQADLAQMQHLVEQGLAYARSAHPPQEADAPTDLVALLETLVADHQDAQQPVRWLGGPACTLRTRPAALRRALVNLVDNAVKFGGQAEVALVQDGDATVVQVLDRGPGIPAEELAKVVMPFYRIEPSRNAATGGTGLGLAIVQRLLPHCGASLHLAPRDGGGWVASVRFAAAVPGAGPLHGARRG